MSFRTQLQVSDSIGKHDLVAANRIAVVFSLDENFIDPFTVAFGSLLMTNDLRRFSFYIFYDDQSDKKIFEERVKQIYKKLEIDYVDSPRFIALNSSKFDGCDKSLNGTHMAYGKVEALSKIDHDIILCIDCDCLIMGDLTEILADYNGEAACAAVRDQRCPSHAHEGYFLDEKPQDSPSTYFNSGVLLINASPCDKNTLNDQFIKAATRTTSSRFDEQTYLNVMFKDQWQELPPIWNSQIREHHQSIFHKSRKSKILHYIGKRKPWLSTAVNEGNYLWMNVAQRLEINTSHISDKLKVSYKRARLLYYTGAHVVIYTLLKILGKSEQRTARKIRAIRTLKTNAQIHNTWLSRYGINPPANPLKLF